MMPQSPPAPIELHCPGCGRYLGTVDGVYFRSPPCVCGLQITLEAFGKRRRALTPCGVGRELEVK